MAVDATKGAGLASSTESRNRASKTRKSSPDNLKNFLIAVWSAKENHSAVRRYENKRQRRQRAACPGEARFGKASALRARGIYQVGSATVGARGKASENCRARFFIQCAFPF